MLNDDDDEEEDADIQRLIEISGGAFGQRRSFDAMDGVIPTHEYMEGYADLDDDAMEWVSDFGTLSPCLSDLYYLR